MTAYFVPNRPRIIEKVSPLPKAYRVGAVRSEKRHLPRSLKGTKFHYQKSLCLRVLVVKKIFFSAAKGSLPIRWGRQASEIFGERANNDGSVAKLQKSPPLFRDDT